MSTTNFFDRFLAHPAGMLCVNRDPESILSRASSALALAAAGGLYVTAVGVTVGGLVGMVGVMATAPGWVTAQIVAGDGPMTANAVGYGVLAQAVAVTAAVVLPKLWEKASSAFSGAQDAAEERVARATMFDAPERTIEEGGDYRIVRLQRGDDYVQYKVTPNEDGSERRVIHSGTGWAIWKDGRGVAMVDGKPAAAVVMGQSEEKFLTCMMPREDAVSQIESGKLPYGSRLVPERKNSGVPEEYHSYFSALDKAKRDGIEGDVITYNRFSESPQPATMEQVHESMLQPEKDWGRGA